MPADEPTGSPMSGEGGGGSKNAGKGMVYRHRPAAGAARAVCFGLLALVLLAGVTALVLYLVYRPSKPRFAVVGAAIYELNATSAPVSAVSASMQVAVTIRNPNSRSAISYDRLVAYVTHRSQAITPPTPLPPLEQEKDSTVAMSPVLGGGPVPVSPEAAAGLAAAEAYGVVALRLVVAGQIRYRPGPFHSTRVGMFVRCDLLVGHRRGVYGQVPLLGGADCSVDA